MSIKRVIYTILRLITAALIAVLVLCGIWGDKVAHCFRAGETGDLASSNRILSDALHVDHPSEKLLAAFSKLAPGRSIALVAPGDDLLGSILLPPISSLVWPRKVYLLPVENGNVRKAFRDFPDIDFAAIAFLDITPPAAGPSERRIGPLTIIPL